MEVTPIHPTVCFMIIAPALVSIRSVLAYNSHRHSAQLLQQTINTHQLLATVPAPPASLPSSQDVHHGNHLPKHAIVGIVIAILALGSSLLCFLLFWLLQNPTAAKAKKKADPSKDQQSWPGAFTSLHLAIGKASSNSAIAVDYTLLRVATDNFSTNSLLGSGGSGYIYKARLNENLFAAVKLLKRPTAASHRLQQAFQTEIELMSKIRHPNLVALLGYSIRSNELDANHLLVYELMLNGSLEDQLHGPSQGAGLNWDMRLKIALDAARGLEHLHEGCNPPIIHRDFKSSNILLDASFNAKVSDFGLAIAMSDISDDKAVELQGTFGYVAPEYLLDGILSEKCDVYAFGVVLLELITGQKPINMSMPVGSQSLVTWASPMLKERTKLAELLDSKIQNEPVDSKPLHQVAAIAALCIQSEPSYRPLMKDVVSSLMPLVPIELGGARREAEEAERTLMTLMVMKAEQRRLSFCSPAPMQDMGKSLSFAEYSSTQELQYPVSQHLSKSDRLTEYSWV